MTFRTSNLAGLFIVVAMGLSIGTIVTPSFAESLKITGPNGEIRQDNVRQYGPTTSADTFWSIAQKVRPSPDVTVYQVMSALFDANPHAFGGNNYNTLEKGMTLMIPSADVIAAIPKEQAKKRAELDNQRVASTTAQSTTDKPATDSSTNPSSPTAISTATKTADMVERKPSAQKPLQIAPEVEKVIAQPIADTQELDKLNEKLDTEHSKNLMLTDELARAQDQLMVSRNDNSVLKKRIDELSNHISNVEENLQILREQHQQLSIEHQALVEATQQTATPPAPESTWRDIMDNVWLLVLLTTLPLLLIFVLVFWLFKRKKNQQELVAAETAVQQQDNESANLAETAAVDVEDDLSDLAVHLDTDEESIDDLLDLDSVNLQPEQAPEIDDSDIVISEDKDQTEAEPETDIEEDEATSLDDLWAEAMEDQEQEFDPIEDDSEDLDKLLDGLDDFEVDSEPESEETGDEIDNLLAEYESTEDSADTTATEPEVNNETDTQAVDDLLAEFDMPAEDSADTTATESEVSDETDTQAVDDLLAEFDMPAEDSADATTTEPEVSDETDTQAVDDLLAEFDMPAEDSADATTTEPEVSDETDTQAVDNLLAEFDMPAEADSVADSSNEESELENSTLDDASDEIAKDNEVLAELDVELNAELDDILDEQETTDDVDALLASLEAPVDESVSDTPVLDDVISKELDAELNELGFDNDVDDASTDDIDALLADLDAPVSDTAADEIAEELASEIDDLDASVDSDDEAALDSLLAAFDEPANDGSEAIASDDISSLVAGINSDSDISLDLDALLAEPGTSADEYSADVAQDTVDSNDSQDNQIIAETAQAEQLDALLNDLAVEPTETEQFSASQEDNDETLSTPDENTTDEPTDELDFLLDSLSNEAQTSDNDHQLQDHDELASELDSLLADINQPDDPQAQRVEDDTLLSTELNAAPLTDTSSVEVVNDDAAAQELEELLATMGQDTVEELDPVATQADSNAKDSGFFDDLKANKSSEDKSIDWDSSLFDTPAANLEDISADTSPSSPSSQPPQHQSVTDDELLAAFSESLGEQESETLTSEDEYLLSDDELSVDAALAALDTTHAPQESSQQQGDDEYIAIDKLLNDADEEVDGVDLYKDVDVDVGEVNAIIGDTDMVDVDDEENSVNAKLDLARAYIEIEDKDNAIALLKEVQVDGNERQQQEAGLLLNNLG